MIILDFGSGNTCQNDIGKVRELIDSVEGKDVIIKWQLFQEGGINIPLKRAVFEKAYTYANKKGLSTTASVFDIESLRFLKKFDIPFIKLANNPICYKLARLIHTPMIVSYPSIAEMGKRKDIKPLCCVSRYPAQAIQYEKNFISYWLTQGISDHTEGFDLYHKYQPEIWEKHYVLKHDKNNPDGGIFAMTPSDLQKILPTEIKGFVKSKISKDDKKSVFKEII